MVASSREEANAWSTFWAEQGAGARCLQRASPTLLEKLNSHWGVFAASLPPHGAVLDLGCGGGTVGRLLLAAQPGLQVTGVDFAVVRESDDSRLILLSRTAMERLPFADASFDAAVSQFGYEYGSLEDAARELARVLRAGAPFSFLIHHAHSPLVKGMRSHRAVIASVCGAELLGKFISGDREALDRELRKLNIAFPQDSVVSVVTKALRTHVRDEEDQRSRLRKQILDALAPEAVMLARLEEYCVAPENMEAWLRPLRAQFVVEGPDALNLATGEPIAWRVHGRRRR